MITYPSLGLPEAWRPVFRAMGHRGWDLVAAMGRDAPWRCREILAFEQAGRRCYLSVFEEAEWCGNNYQQGAITVLGLSTAFPETREMAEAHMLVLTGDWEEEVDSFLFQFLG